MVSDQINDVPEETPDLLRRRAAAARQSLQEYLRSRLIHEASRPTVEEVLTTAASRPGGALRLRQAALLVADERDRGVNRSRSSHSPSD